MNIEKLKWKLRIRLEQVQCLFKLGYYNILKLLNLEGDESLYYHLQRDLMRYIIHMDLEQEYRIEHGLAEPEEDLEEEPEEEKEPGLRRSLNLFELAVSRLEIGEISYLVTEMKEYDKEVCLEIATVDENFEYVRHNICVQQDAGGDFVDLTLNGQDLRFDIEERTLSCRGSSEKTAGDPLNCKV